MLKNTNISVVKKPIHKTHFGGRSSQTHLSSTPTRTKQIKSRIKNSKTHSNYLFVITITYNNLQQR
jgi:hypothetical protein